MKKKFLTALLFLFTSFYGYTQESQNKKTLSPEDSKKIISELNIDTLGLLQEISTGACLCIDSITTDNKDMNEIAKDISDCIDKRVGAYQLSMKMYYSMKDTGKKNNNITLNTDRQSYVYKKYYYEMERWLKDSCKSLDKKMATNEKISDHSMSTNLQAILQYNEGIKLMETKQYEKALPFYKKAVEIDPTFAFAWDNIGVCNRRLSNWDEAIAAYRKSLALDPKGLTPLHNLPVVYEFKKEYDKALEEYRNIAKVYPDDPEAYYGAGRIYIFFTVDLEKGLDNMCKAYNAYIKLSSPYRVDAEKNINYIYSLLKKEGKEETFSRILKENNIKTSKN